MACCRSDTAPAWICCARLRNSCAKRASQRLEGEFEHAYRYVEPLFGGRNPYLEAIDRNLGYLDRVLRTERWPMLRRNPPLFTSDDTQIGQVRGLMLNRLKELWAY